MNKKNEKVLPDISVTIEMNLPSDIEFDSVPNSVCMIQVFSTPDEAVQMFRELRLLVLEKLELDSLDDETTS